MTPGSLRRLAPLALLSLALLPAGTAHATCTTNSWPTLAAPDTSGAGCLQLSVGPAVSAPGDSVSASVDGASAGTTTYSWDFGDGTTDTTSVSTDDHVYATRGVYTITVTTTGGTTESVTDSHTVTETPVAHFTASMTDAGAGESITFDGSGSTSAGGTITGYAWDWNADGTFDLITTSPTATHAYAAPGVQHPVLRVVNDLGATNDGTGPAITVSIHSPVAHLTAPATAATGAPVTLSAAGSTDAYGTIVGYAWDLDGDGSYETSTGATPSVRTSFPVAGSRRVAVKVIDDHGAGGFASASIAVSDPAASGGGGGGGTGGGGTKGGAGGATGGGGSTGRVKPAAFSVRLSGASIQKRSRIRRGGLALLGKANRISRGTLTATAKIGKRRVSLGRVTLRFRANRQLKIRVKLSKRGAKALRRLKKRAVVYVTVAGTVRDAHGTRRSVKRFVLLRG